MFQQTTTAVSGSPASVTGRPVRIGDPAVLRLAVEGCDVVFRDGASISIAVALACPTLYPSEQALDPGAIRRDRIAVAGWDGLLDPLPLGVLLQHGHQAGCLSEGENDGKRPKTLST